MMQDEQTRISSAQQGNLAAFNQLVLSYQEQAYNLAYRLLNDADLAADATQEAFIKAYHALHQYRGGSFRAWLLRIVSNTCIDLLRRQRHRRSISREDLLEAEELESALISHVEDPLGYALRQELGLALQDALSSLPAEQRLIVILFDVEGLSYQEIAQVMQAPMGTVRSRLSRARARLRDLLTLAEPEVSSYAPYPV